MGLQKKISTLQRSSLLVDDEVIIIVDDDPIIREALLVYFREQGLKAVGAGSRHELCQELSSICGALVLLDFGLPDADGVALIEEIKSLSADTSIIMLSGVADLKVAVSCIRKGADDYLTKPVHFTEIGHVVARVLEKRRLLLDNRRYQSELEQSSFRISLLRQLAWKMNSLYLESADLDDILRAILVATTFEYGLGFNRAFLLMVDDEGQRLKGRLAIGPACREEAGRVWDEMKDRHLDFFDIINNLKEQQAYVEGGVNETIANLQVDLDQDDHILVRSVLDRQSFKVEAGRSKIDVSSILLDLLASDSFVVVPLFAPDRPIGVIIADNFVTGRSIADSEVEVLELFAGQASLVIEQARLRRQMQGKIVQLQELARELDDSKDLLVESECYAAVGQMAAQVLHVIKNPVTAIGGVARMLAKKIEDDHWRKFLEVMVLETDRLETSLSELFDFVSKTEIVKEKAHLNPLIHKSILLLQSAMERQGVSWQVDLTPVDPLIDMDRKQVQQVFLNIFRNSLDVMNEGGRLTVSSRCADGFVEIVVRDTGPGICESGGKRLLEPFYTTKAHGTGMGLAMVDRYVVAHGGNFSLGQYDGGAEVKVSLPLTHRDDEDK